MADTLYATFADPNRARTAADELMASGVNANEISLLVREDSHVKHSLQGVELGDTRPTTVLRGEEFNTAFDPLSNGIRQSTVPRIERGIDVELNPAQDDYPRTGAATPTELSSVPTNFQRDYNPGLEGDDYNKHYTEGASQDMDRDARDSRMRADNELAATPKSDVGPDARLRFSRGYNGIDENSPQTMRVDPDAEDYRDADTHVHHPEKDEMKKNVVTGAGIGLGVGAAAAAAALLLPGVGLFIGGGALAAAAAALAAGVGTGAVAGGVATFLKEHGGVPDDTARRYAEVYDGGGAILAITLSRPEMRESIEDVLRRNGAHQMESHQAYMA